jgi:putative flippase GtrA
MMRAGRTVSRFLVCGATAAITNWLARIALAPYLGFESAVLAAYGIAMVVAFALYRSLVWPDGGHSLRRQIGGFLVVNMIGAVVVVWVAMAARIGFTAFAIPAGIADALAHGLGIAVAAGVNYVAHARITFGIAARG